MWASLLSSALGGCEVWRAPSFVQLDAILQVGGSVQRKRARPPFIKKCARAR